MTENQELTGASELQRIFADITTAANPESALIALLLDSARRQDPELPEVLRACAIPRRFDARIIGVLQDTDAVSGRTNALLEMVRSYNFVLDRDNGGFVYHDNTREALLQDWTSTEEKKQQFDVLNDRLASFYEEMHKHALHAQQDLEQLSSVMAHANLARYRRIAALIDSRLSAPLLEGVYHRLLSSPDFGFAEFSRHFEELEKAGHLSLCRSLVFVTRDFIQRLPNEHDNVAQLLWLNYFEARILRQLPPYDFGRAQTILQGLLQSDNMEARLRVWALADLALVYEAQHDLGNARRTREVLMEQVSATEEDVYNIPLYHQNVGRLYEVIGDLKAAATQYQAAINVADETAGARSDMRASARAQLSHLHGLTGNWVSAFELAVEALFIVRTLHPTDEGLAGELSERFAQLLSYFNLPAAHTAAQECLSLMPPSPFSRLATTQRLVDIFRTVGCQDYAQARLAHLEEELGRSEYGAQLIPDLLWSTAMVQEDQGRLADSIATYTRIIEGARHTLEAGWAVAAALSNRGIAYVQLGRWNDAKRDIADALNRWEAFSCPSTAALVKCHLGDMLRRKGLFDEAHRQFSESAQLSTSVSLYSLVFHRLLGELYRSQGEWEQAREQFRRGLLEAKNRRDLSSQLRILNALALVAADQAKWSEVSAHQTDAAAVASDLARQAGYSPSPAEESASRINAHAMRVFCTPLDRSAAVRHGRELFRQACEGCPENFWPWLNLSFAHAELEEWQGAESALSRVLRLCPEPMRTSKLYESWREYAVKAADALERAGDQEAAASLLLDVVTRIDHHLSVAEVGSLRVRLTAAYLGAGRIPEARETYAAALRDVGEDDSPGAELGQRLRSTLRSIEAYWSIDDCLRAWAEAADTDARVRDDVAAARAELNKYLDVTFRLAAAETEVVPLVTPIVVEVGDSLIPIVDSRQDGGTFLYQLIPEMRERVERSMGVRVPGLRMRGNPALSRHSYSIHIDETPVSTGSVEPTMSFIADSLGPTDPAACEPTSRSDRHPITGAHGRWISYEQRDLLPAPGGELIAAPAFMIYEIEAVLRRYLDLFFGPQEAITLFQKWEALEDGQQLMKQAMPDARTRLRFTWLLRALLRDSVPITDHRLLLQATIEVGGASAPLGDLVRAVRAQLRDRLPGAAPDVLRIRLPQTFEQRLTSSSTSAGFPAITPQTKHEVLVWLRKEMRDYRHNVALVTESSELRPLLSRMVMAEFPALPVLAADEVCSRTA